MIWYFITCPFLKPVGVHSPHRAHHLSTWLWRPGGLIILSPMDLKHSETVLVRVPFPSNYTDTGLKHPQAYYEKAYLLAQELQPEGEASGFPHIQSLQTYSQRTKARSGMPFLHTTLALLRLTSTFQQVVHTLICIWYCLNYKNEKIPGFLNSASYIYLKSYLKGKKYSCLSYLY